MTIRTIANKRYFIERLDGGVDIHMNEERSCFLYDNVFSGRYNHNELVVIFQGNAYICTPKKGKDLAWDVLIDGKVVGLLKFYSHNSYRFIIDATQDDEYEYDQMIDRVNEENDPRNG